MTAEQAINELKFDRGLYESEIVSAGDGTPDGDLMLALDMGIAALEKQIPKKITHEATLQRCATCPTCKNVLDEFIKFIPDQPKIRVTFTHCHFCGQALDWGETE